MWTARYMPPKALAAIAAAWLAPDSATVLPAFQTFLGKRVVFPSGILTGSGLTMQSWLMQKERNVGSADGDQ